MNSALRLIGLSLSLFSMLALAILADLFHQIDAGYMPAICLVATAGCFASALWFLFQREY